MRPGPPTRARAGAVRSAEGSRAGHRGPAAAAGVSMSGRHLHLHESRAACVASSPFRYCRRQTVSSERQMPCRRAVAETCRCPRWLSSTTRILSASLQCRRRGPSSADRISIWGVNLKSTITSDLSSPPAPRQTAPAGGLLRIGQSRRRAGFPPQGDTAQCALCRVVCQADAPILEEEREGVSPVLLEHVGDRLRDGVVIRHGALLGPHPVVQVLDQGTGPAGAGRRGFRLAMSDPLIWRSMSKMASISLATLPSRLRTDVFTCFAQGRKVSRIRAASRKEYRAPSSA